MRALTSRQMEIAGLVARGMSTKAIACEIGISEKTVDHHVQQAAARLPGDAPAQKRLLLWFVQLKQAPPKDAA